MGEGLPLRADYPRGHVEVCKGFTPSHLKQVSALSRWVLPYPIRYRPAFAFCFFLCPLHHGRRLRFGCHLLLAVAMHRVYLVSQDAHPAGRPEVGVRDVLSAARS